MDGCYLDEGEVNDQPKGDDGDDGDRDRSNDGDDVTLKINLWQ